MPSEFHQLKHSIKRHFISHQHVRNAQNSEMKLVQTISAPIAICSTAYYVLRNSLKASAFTHLIHMQSISGTDVGNLCHSKKTLFKLRSHITTEIMGCVTQFCKTTTCVSLVADKVTLNGQAMEVVGIIAIIPDAKPGEIIQSLVIGAPIAQ